MAVGVCKAMVLGNIYLFSAYAHLAKIMRAGLVKYLAFYSLVRVKYASHSVKKEKQ